MRINVAMGSITSMFSDCFKPKQDIEKPILSVDNCDKLTRLSDIIENKTVQWNTYSANTEEQYQRMLCETMNIRRKYRGNSI
jgi:hypothetical protein